METKKTKIVCTIGPASWDPERLSKMIAAGMDVARVNGAFADVEELKRVAKLIRSISNDIALMLDIKGHEVRLNKFAEQVNVKPGDKVVIGGSTKDPLYPATYLNLYKDIQKGQRILVDKGETELEVLQIKDKNILTKVITGTVIESGKGMNFPGAKLTNAPVTNKDIEQIKFAVKDKWDFISASFIRNAKDIQIVRKHTGTSLIKLIAKIEDQQGVDNFEEILMNSDGIMIARGDMGSEIPIERLPIIQKEIIHLCNKAGKPVITATNMLESMTEKLFPTRAEITDVANAVLDGTDAVMTSAETTTGKNPIQTVETMSKIALENEKYIIPEIEEPLFLDSEMISVAISDAAFEVANTLKIDKVLIVSKTGTLARILARNNFSTPLITFVSEEIYKRQLQLTKGIIPFTFPKNYKDRDAAINGILSYSLNNKIINKTDKILLVGRASIPGSYFPNIFEYIEMKNFNL